MSGGIVLVDAQGNRVGLSESEAVDGLLGNAYTVPPEGVRVVNARGEVQGVYESRELVGLLANRTVVGDTGAEASAARGNAASYDTPLEKAAQVAYGAASVVTAGLSDMGQSDEDKAARAALPGSRAIGEGIGLVGSILTGAGAPAAADALGARAGAQITSKLGGGAGAKVIGTATQGVVDAGSYGTIAGAVEQSLSEDPFDLEALGSSVLQQALLGGGVGGGLATIGLGAKKIAGVATDIKTALRGETSLAGKLAEATPPPKVDFSVGGLSDSVTPSSLEPIDDIMAKGRAVTEEQGFSRAASKYDEAHARKLATLDEEISTLQARLDEASKPLPPVGEPPAPAKLALMTKAAEDRVAELQRTVERYSSPVSLADDLAERAVAKVADIGTKEVEAAQEALRKLEQEGPTMAADTAAAKRAEASYAGHQREVSKAKARVDTLSKEAAARGKAFPEARAEELAQAKKTLDKATEKAKAARGAMKAEADKVKYADVKPDPTYAKRLKEAQDLVEARKAALAKSETSVVRSVGKMEALAETSSEIGRAKKLAAAQAELKDAEAALAKRRQNLGRGVDQKRAQFQQDAEAANAERKATSKRILADLDAAKKARDAHVSSYKKPSEPVTAREALKGVTRKNELRASAREANNSTVRILREMADESRDLWVAMRADSEGLLRQLGDAPGEIQAAADSLRMDLDYIDAVIFRGKYAGDKSAVTMSRLDKLSPQGHIDLAQAVQRANRSRIALRGYWGLDVDDILRSQAGKFDGISAEAARVVGQAPVSGIGGLAERIMQMGVVKAAGRLFPALGKVASIKPAVVAAIAGAVDNVLARPGTYKAVRKAINFAQIPDLGIDVPAKSGPERFAEQVRMAAQGDYFSTRVSDSSADLMAEAPGIGGHIKDWAQKALQYVAGELPQSLDTRPGGKTVFTAQDQLHVACLARGYSAPVEVMKNVRHEHPKTIKTVKALYPHHWSNFQFELLNRLGGGHELSADDVRALGPILGEVVSPMYGQAAMANLAVSVPQPDTPQPGAGAPANASQAHQIDMSHVKPPPRTPGQMYAKGSFNQ